MTFTCAAGMATASRRGDPCWKQPRHGRPLRSSYPLPGDAQRALRRGVSVRFTGTPFLSTANCAGFSPERNSLILSKGMARAPAISDWKLSLPSAALTTCPVSWSPLVKISTSGAGGEGLAGAGVWAGTKGEIVARARIEAEDKLNRAQ